MAVSVGVPHFAMLDGGIEMGDRFAHMIRIGQMRLLRGFGMLQSGLCMLGQDVGMPHFSVLRGQLRVFERFIGVFLSKGYAGSQCE